MKPEHWIAIVGILLTTLVTAIGLYLGPKRAVKQAIEQFRSQKWWEKQEQTYSSLLDALAVILSHLSAEWEREIGTNHLNASDEEMVRYRKAELEVDTRFGQGAYLVSDTTIEALGKLIATRDADHYSSVAHELDNYIGEMKACIQVVRREARNALSSR